VAKPSGKTISVSMFAAALLYSCAGIELSIYSTCKRISQKLLRNVVKFLNLIYEATGETPMPVIRGNCEEIHIQGPEGSGDIRVTNSYPSKVTPPPTFPTLLDIALNIHHKKMYLCGPDRT
jgi:hypothetical protein